MFRKFLNFRLNYSNLFSNLYKCFSDLVGSTSRTRKESPWEEMTPGMYKREDLSCLNDHHKIISDTYQLQPLEHLKCTSGEANSDFVDSTPSVEFFMQTQAFKSVKNTLFVEGALKKSQVSV